MKAATSATISTLTMVEVLRSASDKACAPASSTPRCCSGASGGIGAGAASAGPGLESGWEGSLAMVWSLPRRGTAGVVRCAVQQIERRRLRAEDQAGAFLQRLIDRSQVEQELGQFRILLEYGVVLRGLLFRFADD